jgi:hypothetical protein
MLLVRRRREKDEGRDFIQYFIVSANVTVSLFKIVVSISLSLK